MESYESTCGHIKIQENYGTFVYHIVKNVVAKHSLKRSALCESFYEIPIQKIGDIVKVDNVTYKISTTPRGKIIFVRA